MARFMLRHLRRGMSTIDYQAMAEDWLAHVLSQYEMTHVCASDVLLIERLLAAGLPVAAVRDKSKVLRIGSPVQPGAWSAKPRSTQPFSPV